MVKRRYIKKRRRRKRLYIPGRDKKPYIKDNKIYIDGKLKRGKGIGAAISPLSTFIGPLLSKIFGNETKK